MVNTAVVLGGSENTAGGDDSVVLGGAFQSTTAYGAGVFAGSDNKAQGLVAATVGGEFNQANGTAAAAVGGRSHIASGNYSIIAGGNDNNATANQAATLGGSGNTAAGVDSVVLGGAGKTASGQKGVASGNRAKAAHNSTFVWADSQDADFQSSNQDQFLVRAANGVGINTTSPLQSLHIGGTPGTHGIMFPDGTTQTTAFTGTIHSLDASDGNPTDRVAVDAVGNTRIGNVPLGPFLVEQYNWEASYDITSAWQSFTAPGTGTLTGVTLYFLPTNNATVTIRQGEGDGGAILGTTVVSAGGQSEYNIAFSPPIALTSGNQYTIHVTAGVFQWPIKYSNIYAGGRASQDSNYDHWFRVEGSAYLDSAILYVQQTTGRVGLGTNSPDAKLHIAGTAGSDGIKYPDGTVQTTAYSPATFSVSSLDASDGSPTDVVAADAAGHVEIGSVTTFFVENYYQDGDRSPDDAWQSFTAPHAAMLSALTVLMNHTTDNSTVNVSIYQGEGTGGSLLGTTTMIVGEPADEYTATFSPGIILTSGNIYTMRLSSLGMRWNCHHSNPYSGGRSSRGPNVDQWFRVTAQPTGIFVNSYTGYVGVGTKTPAYQLQLSTDSAAKPGTSSWTVASDARLKDVGAAFTRSLDALKQIHPVKFNYKQSNALGLPGDQEYVGVLAQDVQAGVPEAVSTDDKGYLHMNTDAVFWTVVNSVKELETENEKLRNDNTELRREKEQLEQRMERIEKLLERD